MPINIFETARSRKSNIRGREAVNKSVTAKGPTDIMIETRLD